MIPKKLQKISTKELTWINIVDPKSKDLSYFERKFNIHPVDLADCLPPLQRPKLVERPGYLFMILLFPVFDRKTREVTPSEVDFFISKDHIITVHDGRLEPLANFFEDCMKDESFQGKYLSGNPAALLYETLSRLLTYCFPMLNHISLNIDEIEKQIFAGYEKRMLREIMIVKRNIVNFRKAMQFHENVILKLINRAHRFFSTDRLNIYFTDLVDHTKDIWDSLEIYKDTINALHETNESLISFRLNDIMKMLTLISVTMLPVTLIASIFGMNSANMPLVHHPWGFWIVLSMMFLIGMLMVWYFKKKKWL